MGASIPLCGILIFVSMSNTCVLRSPLPLPEPLRRRSDPLLTGYSFLISGLTPDWIGNNISFEGCDGNGCTRLDIPAVGYIGEAPGSGAWA